MSCVSDDNIFLFNIIENNDVIISGITSGGLDTIKSSSILTIPSTLTYSDNIYNIIEIDNSTFFNIGLNIIKLILSDGIKRIGDLAFYGNIIQNVTLPHSLTKIGYDAFGANEIKTVTMQCNYSADFHFTCFNGNPYCVILISPSINARWYAYNNNTFAFGQQGAPFGILSNDGDFMFSLDNDANAVITRFTSTGLSKYSDPNIQKDFDIPSTIAYDDIPYTVKNIHNEVFHNKGLNIKTLTLHDGIVNIGSNTFAENIIRYIILPPSLQSIGQYAFGRNYIQNVTMHCQYSSQFNPNCFDNNPNCAIFISSELSASWPSMRFGDRYIPVGIPRNDGTFVFFLNENNSSAFIVGLTPTAFGLYTNPYVILQDLTIPGEFSYQGSSYNVLEILNNTFFNMCLNIDNLILSDGIQIIDSGTFAYNNIHKVILPYSLTTIKNYTFSYNNITSIIIPPRVTSIGNNAFSGNMNLTKVLFLGNKPNIDVTAFSETNVNNINVTTNTNGWDNELYDIPISVICFPSGTPIVTDQGIISIQDIDPSIHTIRNKKIVAITKSVSPYKFLIRIEKNSLGSNVPLKATIMSHTHCIFYKGRMLPAIEFFEKGIPGVSRVKYDGEILYNVLMEQHEKMLVNNLIVESLHPENNIALLYREVLLNDKYSQEEKKTMVKNVNQAYKQCNNTV